MTAMRSAVGVCREPHTVCIDCGWGREAGEFDPFGRHDCANPGRVLGWGVGSDVTARGVQCRVVRVDRGFTFGHTADLLYGPGLSLRGVGVDEVSASPTALRGAA